jgi:hypothetical protein
MKRVFILNSPVYYPRVLTSAECENLRVEDISCSPAWLVFPIVSESDGGGQLYSPSRRGGNVDAGIYALLAQA